MTTWNDEAQLVAAFNGELGPLVEDLANATVHEMASGDYGPEAQGLAESWLEEAEMSFDDLEQLVPDDDPEATRLAELSATEELATREAASQHLKAEKREAFDNELEALEKYVRANGRSNGLTGAERQRLFDELPEQGPIQGFVQRYGKEFAERGLHDEEGHRARMVEAAEDAQRAAEEAEPEPAERPDYSNETQDERIERMVAAADAAGEAD